MNAKDFNYSRVLKLIVELEPFTSRHLRDYLNEFDTNRDESHPLEMSAAECCMCLEDVTRRPHVHCLECVRVETILCTKCFKLGVEAGEHRRGHNYEIIDKLGPTLYDAAEIVTKNISDTQDDLVGEGTNPRVWGCHEDTTMLDSFVDGRLQKWWEVDHLFPTRRHRSMQDALDRLDRRFLRSQIGDYVIGELKNGSLRLPRDDTFEPSRGTGEDFAAPIDERTAGPSSSSSSLCSFAGPPFGPSTSDFNMKDAFERQLALFYDPFGAYGNAIAMDEDLDGSSPQTPSNSSPINKKANRREMLENAKSVASEMLRGSRITGRARKSSLELSETLNLDEEVAGRFRHQSSSIMTESRLMELRSRYPQSYFSANAPKKMSRDAVAMYDHDDLQIIGYMPLRNDYEHEYKQSAEHLIDRIAFRQAPITDKNDVEKFMDVVKLAKIQRYNRVLEMRAAKRGAIVEHDMVNEFLQIAKNNLSERGKYNIFDEKFFGSKRKEEEYKPLFAKLRQVADRTTVNQLARNIGKMENLMDQIEELRELQKAGVTTLKGKLKVDKEPPSWSKKRRCRKADNVEVKKANARWKRIIRWSKKQPDMDEHAAASREDRLDVVVGLDDDDE